MTQLYIVRHSETQENVNQILQGHLPGHLTRNGYSQAEELREELVRRKLHFDALLVSPLHRTLLTANILNKAYNLPLTPVGLLRERNWGSLTGCPISQAHAAPIPDDAETVEEMFSRARRFLRFVAKAYPEKCVLAVGHGLFNRCVMAAHAGCAIRDIPRMQNAEVRLITLSSTGGRAAPGEQALEVISAD